MEKLTTTNVGNSFNGPFTVYSTRLKGYYNFTINNIKIENKEKKEKVEDE